MKAPNKLITSVWTQNGKIYAKQDKDDTPTLIKNKETLEKYREWVTPRPMINGANGSPGIPGNPPPREESGVGRCPDNNESK